MSETDDTRVGFMDAINNTYSNLQMMMVGQHFLVLKLLVMNNWGHPVLSAMLSGKELDEERGNMVLSLCSLNSIIDQWGFFRKS